jgi:hypothetical protein
MTRRVPSPALALALLAPTLVLGSGCELLDQLQMRTGIVDVYAGSHATPDEQGNMPSSTSEQLILTNDMGWKVYVDEAYVTTAAVGLRACDGEHYDVELYWGPLSENMRETASGELGSLGGVRAESGNYCDVIVGYAPVADTSSSPDAVGTTVYLRGSAVKDGELVPFAWATALEVEVEIDISTLELGQPFRISREQHFAKKLSVSKSYSSFFAGVDFSDPLSQADIDSLLVDSLSTGTVAKLL